MTNVTNTTVPTCANILGGGVGEDERGTDISTAVSGTTLPTYANHPRGGNGEVKTGRWGHAVPGATPTCANILKGGIGDEETGVEMLEFLMQQHLPVPTSWEVVLVMRRQALRSWVPDATPTCANILKGGTCDKKTGTEILVLLVQHLPVPTSWEMVLVTRRQALRSWSSWWSCCSLVLAFFTMLLTLDSDFLSVDTSRSFSAPSLIFISLRISFFSTWKTKGLMRCTWSIMHWIYSVKSCHMNERESISLILGVLSHISILCIVKVTCALLTCCYRESVYNFSEGSHHPVSFHVHVFIFLLHSWQ